MSPSPRTVVLALCACAVLAIPASGQQVVIQQQDGATAQFSVSLGADTAAPGKTTTHAQEQKALGIMRRDTNRRKEAIEAAVLLEAAVMEALDVARKAMAAYSEALESNEDYALLQEEKANVNTERQGLYRSGSGVDPKERRQKHKELSKQLAALSKEIAEFAENTPEIQALAEGKAKAVEAFVNVFEAACKAHPKWAALQDDIEDINDWSPGFGTAGRARLPDL